jgi:hypothetical protein
LVSKGGFADVHSGVIDEDMNRTEGGLGLGGHVLDALLGADVERERKNTAAEGFNLRGEGLEGVAIAAGEDQVRSGVSEGAGEVLAQAAACAGDKGNLAGEIEKSARLQAGPGTRH